MNTFSKEWFASRLRNFLYERHPRLEEDEKLIDHRSILASAQFQQAKEKG